MADRLRAAVPWEAAPLLLPVPPTSARVHGTGPREDHWRSCLARSGLTSTAAGSAQLVIISSVADGVRAIEESDAQAVLLAGRDTSGRLQRAGLHVRTWSAQFTAGGAVALVADGPASLRPSRFPGSRARAVALARRLSGGEAVTVASRSPGPPALLAAAGAERGYLLAGGGGSRRRAVLVGGPAAGRPSVVVKAAAPGDPRGGAEQEVLTRLHAAGLGRRVPEPLGAGTCGAHQWSAESAVPGHPLADLLGRRRDAARTLAVVADVGEWLGELGAVTRTPRTWGLSQDDDRLRGEHRELRRHREGLDGVPGVLSHGDLGSAVNLLVDQDGWAVVDWETSRPGTEPLRDLLPLLCGALAALRAPDEPGGRAAYVLRLCAGVEPDSPWALGLVRRYLARVGVPRSAAGSLAALAFGQQASMRLLHQELVAAAGDEAGDWQSHWDAVARAWDGSAGLGRTWPALDERD